MENQTSLQALMNEKHTLREWLILFQTHPELREEFEKLVHPQPIK